MKLVDCKSIREEILEEVKRQVAKLDYVPHIHIISIGDDEASKTYINNKIKTAVEVGIKSSHYIIDGNVTQEEAEEKIIKIAQTKKGGVMLQLPIPEHLDENRLISLIPQFKDVDGLTSLNMGMLTQGDKNAIIPATANAVYHIIKKYYGSDLKHLNVSVVNRSKLIGQPLQSLLTNNDATVTLCHSKTKNLDMVTSKSDIIVTGIGRAKHFKQMHSNQTNNLSDKQLIIDCGINYVDGKLFGDWDEEEMEKCNDAIILTPVGKKRAGVGSLTTACLMLSTIKCCEMQKEYSLC